MRICSLIIVFFLSQMLLAQGGWNWAELSSLPEPVANNALTEAHVGNKKYVYSFGGIGSALDMEAVTNKSFKYDVSNDQWLEIQSLPDTLGKMGAGASFVRNRVYVIGGYGFDQNSNEVISNQVHVFNPFIDTFEVDGASLPIPVADHVQAVWRDSLIFVVTGWGDGQTVPHVQIYNPAFNSWVSGESVPDNTFFSVHGGSGYILGDTLFYFGGAAGDPDVLARNHLRKGVIDPEDPSQITWTFSSDAEVEPLYKSVASGHDKTVFWFGGSEEAYEFDGLSYTSGQFADPAARVLQFNSRNGNYTDIQPTEIAAMDLRGIAKLGGGNWIVAGGIDSLGMVSDRTFLLNNPNLSFILQAKLPPFFEVERVNDFFKVETENVGRVFVYNTAGQLLFSARKQLADLYIPVHQLHAHFLLFVYDDGSNVPVSRKLVKTD
jgi:hypothetical protein